MSAESAGVDEQGSGILRLRGLPFQVTEPDVHEFLGEVSPVLVHICKRRGRATGDAYVEFASQTEAEIAKQEKHGQKVNYRYVEIFEVPLRELGPAAGSRPPRLAGYVVRLRGLPFTATLTDVLQFFQGLELAHSPPGVVFTCTPDGRPSGEAYVEFMTAAAQQLALQRHKQQLGSRYIELFPSSKGDLFHSIQQNGYYTGLEQGLVVPEAGLSQAEQQQSPGAGQSHITSDTLRLRGLPYSAGLQDIESFFTGYQLAPKGIHILSRSDRGGMTQSMGFANVRFASAAEAERARVAKHRTMMGTRYIECLLPQPDPRGGRPLLGRPPDLMGPHMNMHVRPFMPPHGQPPLPLGMYSGPLPSGALPRSPPLPLLDSQGLHAGPEEHGRMLAQRSAGQLLPPQLSPMPPYLHLQQQQQHPHPDSLVAYQHFMMQQSLLQQQVVLPLQSYPQTAWVAGSSQGPSSSSRARAPLEPPARGTLHPGVHFGGHSGGQRPYGGPQQPPMHGPVQLQQPPEPPLLQPGYGGSFSYQGVHPGGQQGVPGWAGMAAPPGAVLASSPSSPSGPLPPRAGPGSLAAAQAGVAEAAAASEPTLLPRLLQSLSLQTSTPASPARLAQAGLPGAADR